MGETLSQKERFLKEHGKYNIAVEIEYNQVSFYQDYTPADGVNVFETFDEALEGGKKLYAKHRIENIAYIDYQQAKLESLTDSDVVPLP